MMVEATAKAKYRAEAEEHDRGGLAEGNGSS